MQVKFSILSRASSCEYLCIVMKHNVVYSLQTFNSNVTCWAFPTNINTFFPELTEREDMMASDRATSSDKNSNVCLNSPRHIAQGGVTSL